MTDQIFLTNLVTTKWQTKFHYFIQEIYTAKPTSKNMIKSKNFPKYLSSKPYEKRHEINLLSKKIKGYELEPATLS